MRNIFNKTTLSQDFYFLNILKTSIVIALNYEQVRNQRLFVSGKQTHFSKTLLHMLPQHPNWSFCFHRDPLQPQVGHRDQTLREGFPEDLKVNLAS